MGNIFAAIFLTSEWSKRLPGWSVSISKWIREPKCPTSRLGQKQLMAQRWVLASGSPNTCSVALTLTNNEFISACCIACLPELHNLSVYSIKLQLFENNALKVTSIFAFFASSTLAWLLIVPATVTPGAQCDILTAHTPTIRILCFSLRHTRGLKM